MAFVPEGQADRSQARSAWVVAESPVPEGRSKSLSAPNSVRTGGFPRCLASDVTPNARSFESLIICEVIGNRQTENARREQGGMT
jgi:hypothetical protein